MSLIDIQFISYQGKYTLMFEYNPFIVFVDLNSPPENNKTVKSIKIAGYPDDDWGRSFTFDYYNDAGPDLKEVINILMAGDENSILDYIRNVAKLEDLYSKSETK